MVFLTQFNIANAKVVKVEDMGLFNWDEIESNLPGFGSSDSVTLNWNPEDDFYTELLAYNFGYSGRAGAFCWHQKDCALDLSTSVENTQVTLESFFLGYFSSAGKKVVYSVLDLETEAIILSGAPWVGADGAIITVNASSNAGFRILFGDDLDDAGINDIVYNSSPAFVPVPAAVWFFVTGLIGLRRFTKTKA
jgi:hypothetical protein